MGSYGNYPNPEGCKKHGVDLTKCVTCTFEGRCYAQAQHQNPFDFTKGGHTGDAKINKSK